jgi:hypothetical protein
MKATGAELELQAAMRCAAKVSRIESALTQARRDAELLLRRAGELVAHAESYMDVSRAYVTTRVHTPHG